MEYKIRIWNFNYWKCVTEILKLTFYGISEIAILDFCYVKLLCEHFENCDFSCVPEKFVWMNNSNSFYLGTFV